MEASLVLTLGFGLLIGMVIGGVGAGGGVLTVPVLAYLLGQGAHDATTGSVVVVGVTAAAGVLARLRAGSIRWRTGVGFGVVGIPSAVLGSLLSQRVAEPVLLLTFAGLTLLAASAMLLGTPRTPTRPDPVRGRSLRVATVLVGGLAVGFLTGFLGVGGGFLLVPVLVVALRMEMVAAAGTSLLVMAITAAASAVTRIGAADVAWAVVAPFAVAAVVGSVAGKIVAERLSGVLVSRSFAVLLLAVGAYSAVHGVAGP